MTSKVGKSIRTPFKHGILNAITGKIVGSVTKQKWLYKDPFIFIDMCAGDGNSDPASGQASPFILLKHAGFGPLLNLTNSTVHLIEKD